MLAAENGAAVSSHLETPGDGARISWKEIFEVVDPFVHAVSVGMLAQIKEFEPAIASGAHDALASQGKHIRPALLALSGLSAGGINEDMVRVAIIIEMIHLATLVHDDVLDEADLRRGRPTLRAGWGNEVSVLLGDCLCAHAVKMAASFPTPEVCRAVATAMQAVCTGEIVQIQQRTNFNLTRAEYFHVLGLKTGALFALSTELGASLAGAPPAIRNALHQFGMTIGVAYQVYDDCLDLYGNESTSGKSLGSDLASGKITLPILIALERANEFGLNQFQALLHPWHSSSLPEVMEILERCDALCESQRVIHQHLLGARSNLAQLPPNHGRAALNRFVDFLSQQTDGLGGSRT